MTPTRRKSGAHRRFWQVQIKFHTTGWTPASAWYSVKRLAQAHLDSVQRRQMDDAAEVVARSLISRDRIVFPLRLFEASQLPEGHQVSGDMMIEEWGLNPESDDALEALKWWLDQIRRNLHAGTPPQARIAAAYRRKDGKLVLRALAFPPGAWDLKDVIVDPGQYAALAASGAEPVTKEELLSRCKGSEQ